MRIITRLALPFIMLTCIWVSSNLQWGGNRWKNIIEADAKGYYAYLPAVFIYHDLNFGFYDSIERKYADQYTRYEYRTAHNGKIINKYFAGTALAQLPFFLAAHLVTKISGQPADGYSYFYPIMINIGSLVFLLLGLVYVRNFLRSYKVNDSVIAFLLAALVFGTNLFYYAVCEPGLSHVYSFALISMFTYRARKFFITHHKKEIIYCSLLLGIITFIRPVNAVIVLALPFLADSKERFAEGIRAALKERTVFLLSVLALLFIACFQFIIYKVQCGNFFVYSYGEERFNWLHPRPLDFLFSYKKGFFIYTPLTFFAIIGMFYLWRNNRFALYAFLFFSLALIYVLSAWWNWWYGGSFSSRVMIDFYVFAALLLGLAYKLLENKIKASVLTAVIVLAVVLCQLQTYQYRYRLIHWENMTAEKYWDIFLKLPQKE